VRQRRLLQLSPRTLKAPLWPGNAAAGIVQLGFDAAASHSWCCRCHCCSARRRIAATAHTHAAAMRVLRRRRSFPLARHMTFAAEALCRSSRIAPQDLGEHLSGPHVGELSRLLCDLLLGGYVYAADD
jgi:hypothetical protein